MTLHDLHPDHAVVEQLVGLPVADVERDLILATLRETGGNRTHAANLLGIAIHTLRNKFSVYSTGHAFEPKRIDDADIQVPTAKLAWSRAVGKAELAKSRCHIN